MKHLKTSWFINSQNTEIKRSYINHVCCMLQLYLLYQLSDIISYPWNPQVKKSGYSITWLPKFKHIRQLKVPVGVCLAIQICSWDFFFFFFFTFRKQYTALIHKISNLMYIFSVANSHDITPICNHHWHLVPWPPLLD